MLLPRMEKHRKRGSDCTLYGRRFGPPHARHTRFGDGGLPVNLFANPQAVYNNFRNPILGLDTKNYGWGVLTGLPYWNMDMSIKKHQIYRADQF